MEKIMAGSVNKVILVGNLGKDPEVRRMTSGDPVVNLSIATSETWRDKASGEKKEKTEWHRVVIFNKNLADVAEKYLKKGAKVYVEGQLQTRKWNDKDSADGAAVVIAPGIAVTNAHNANLLNPKIVIGARQDYDLLFFRTARSAAPQTALPVIGESVTAYGQGADRELRVAYGTVREIK